MKHPSTNLVSINKRPRKQAIQWNLLTDECKPNDLELVLCTEWAVEDEEEEGSWDYWLGFYDDRGFWIDTDYTVVEKPHLWAVVTDPDLKKVAGG